MNIVEKKFANCQPPIFVGKYHSAIAARQYGIRAVVGTGYATSVIKEGQTIEVDGDNGIVRIQS
jgi:phosphoenolpyruvate-protein kinase (PTS system EI component)